MDNYNNTNNNDNQGYQQNPYQQNPYQQNQQNPYQQNVSPQGTPYPGQNYGGPNYGGQQVPRPIREQTMPAATGLSQGPVVINQLEHKKDNLAVCSLVFGIMALFLLASRYPDCLHHRGADYGHYQPGENRPAFRSCLAGVIVSAISLVLSVIFTLLYVFYIIIKYFDLANTNFTVGSKSRHA